MMGPKLLRFEGKRGHEGDGALFKAELNLNRAYWSAIMWYYTKHCWPV